jgi:hypothetical protein
MDSETLSIALNAELTASGKGKYDIFSGGGHINITGSSKSVTKTSDTMIVLHASVTNGAKYISLAGSQQPPVLVRREDEEFGTALDSVPSIKLSDRLYALMKSDMDAFRQICGDGFVSSIVSGADAYFLLRFHDLDYTSLQKLQVDVGFNFGVAEIFGGESTSKFGGEIEKAAKAGQLSVDFVQSGGTITAIPIDWESAKTKFAGLGADAKAGPRPLYMIVTPYSQLPNVPTYNVVSSLGFKQNLMRYYERLSDVFSEAAAIRNDLMKSAPAAPEVDSSSEKYFFAYRHKLRTDDDLDSTRKSVSDEMSAVSTLLSDYDEYGCDSTKDSANSEECIDIVNRSQRLRYDDIAFWIRLPVPTNALPSDALSAMDMYNFDPDPSAADDRRKWLAQYIFKYRVERISSLRCEMFQECLSPEERRKYMDAIVAFLH